MKECPICHTQYDDNMNFCVKDGHSLVELSNSQQQPSSSPSDNLKRAPRPQPKKNGILKIVLIVAVVIVVGLVGLYQYITNAATYLRAEPEQIIAAKCGGIANVSIDYDGYIWSINHKPDWVEIKEHDNDFDLTFDANTSGITRNGTITIKSGSHLAYVEVAQNGVATYIRPSVSSVKIGKNGGSKTVQVESDGTSWTVQYPQYLTVETSSEGFTVNAPSNDGDYRQGYITLSEDNVRLSLLFEQGGKCPSCHGQGNSICYVCGGMGGTGYGMYYVSCIMCGGKGSIYCSVCGGSGVKE